MLGEGHNQEVGGQPLRERTKHGEGQTQQAWAGRGADYGRGLKEGGGDFCWERDMVKVEGDRLWEKYLNREGDRLWEKYMNREGDRVWKKDMVKGEGSKLW